MSGTETLTADQLAARRRLAAAIRRHRYLQRTSPVDERDTDEVPPTLDELLYRDEDADGRGPVSVENVVISTLSVIGGRHGPSANDPVMCRIPYRDYLATQHWQDTRALALLRADGICKRCHATGRPLHVHHLSYVRLGREAEHDLLVLCAECHAAEHGIIPSGGGS